MALKENIQAIKEEIGAEEQFLESLIKGERFFKKYKFAIIGSILLLVVLGIGYSVNDYLKNKELRLTNEAYLALLQNPNDKKSLDILKKGNKELYLAFLFTQAKKNNNTKELKELLSTQMDPILKDMVKFDLGEDSELYKNIQYLNKGYKLLSENKIKEARNTFSQIPLTSNLNEITKRLNHYQGKAK